MSIEINLSEQNLVEIPTPIFTCFQLTHLLLSSNRITVIPDQIVQLEMLKVLNLKNNLLKTLPENFCLLLTLQEFDLENNEFEEFPETIIQLPALKNLNISKNRFQEFPESFKRLVNQLHVLTFGWFELLGNTATQSNFQHSPMKRHLLRNRNTDDFFQNSNKDFLLENAIALNEKGVVESFKKKDPLRILISNFKRFEVVDPILYFYFAFNWDTHMLKQFISKVQDVNVRWQSKQFEWASKLKIKGEQGDNAFHIAFRKICCTQDDYNRQEQMAKLLLISGVNPNAKNDDKWTPLHIIMNIPQIKTLRWAIEWNQQNQDPQFDFNKKGGPYKQTLLHIAANLGYMKAIVELEFANVFLKNISNLTPRNICTQSLSSLKYLRKLEQKQLKFEETNQIQSNQQRSDILSEITQLVIAEDKIDKLFQEHHPLSQQLLAITLKDLTNSEIEFNQKLPILTKKVDISPKIIKKIKDHLSLKIWQQREIIQRSYQLQTKEAPQNLKDILSRNLKKDITNYCPNDSYLKNDIFLLLVQDVDIKIQSTRTTILEYERLQCQCFEQDNYLQSNNYYNLSKQCQDQRKSGKKNYSQTFDLNQSQFSSLQQSIGDFDLSCIDDEGGFRTLSQLIQASNLTERKVNPRLLPVESENHSIKVRNSQIFYEVKNEVMKSNESVHNLLKKKKDKNIVFKIKLGTAHFNDIN